MTHPNSYPPEQFAKRNGISLASAERIVAQYGHSRRACFFAVKRLKTGRSSSSSPPRGFTGPEYSNSNRYSDVD